jgi:hypothetical protein
VNRRSRSAIGSLFGIGSAAVLWLHPATGLSADTTIASASSTAPLALVASSLPKKTSARAKTANLESYAPANPAERFFVEFRSRAALSFGHVFVVYGEVNARQEVIRSQIAGFVPSGDTRDCENCSAYNWMIGYFVPVPGEIATSDGDLEEQYVTARFRVWVTEDKYNEVVAYINQRKASTRLWHALWHNCGGFVRDVAEVLGLHLPIPIWMYPQDLVIAIREANGVHEESPPLKDAPGSFDVLSVQTVNDPQKVGRSQPSRGDVAVARGHPTAQ